MSTWFERLAGNTGRFAIKVSFLDDPDSGHGARLEESLSWGSFQLWVGGRNLCAHNEEGETIEAVHWYLLPVIEWFVRFWDPLLHEEKLPVDNRAADACRSLKATRFLGLDGAADGRSRSWQNWWSRHALQSCREGGLYPDVVIRRWRSDIEVAWGDSDLAGAPRSFRFLSSSGFTRLPPREVAEPLREVLAASAEALLKRCPDSVRIRQLTVGVGQLAERSETRRQTRLAWLAALAEEATARLNLWKKLASSASSGAPELATEMFDAPASPLVVEGSCAAALMYGSVSPNISEGDAMKLADLLVSQEVGTDETLRRYVRDVPLTASSDVPHEAGYELALDLIEALDELVEEGDSVDIEELLRHFQIRFDRRVVLEDESLRAVSVVGTKRPPEIIVCSSHDTCRWKSGLRFTLAHELCHLLHDRSYGNALAIASGPWAPRDLERRANAFAAMLLMPEGLVNRHWKGGAQPTAGDIASLARKLRVSYTAALFHLHNIGIIDMAGLDRLGRDAWTVSQEWDRAEFASAD